MVHKHACLNLQCRLHAQWKKPCCRANHSGPRACQTCATRPCMRIKNHAKLLLVCMAQKNTGRAGTLKWPRQKVHTRLHGAAPSLPPPLLQPNTQRRTAQRPAPSSAPTTAAATPGAPGARHQQPLTRAIHLATAAAARALQMLTNDGPFSDAPPTRNPSISACCASSPQLASVTEPP